jgi:hypothetical protein
MEWVNIFAKYSFEWGLKSRIYKELKKLNTKWTNNPVNKGGNTLSRHSWKEEVHISNKYMKNVSQKGNAHLSFVSNDKIAGFHWLPGEVFLSSCVLCWHLVAQDEISRGRHGYSELCRAGNPESCHGCGPVRGGWAFFWGRAPRCVSKSSKPFKNQYWPPKSL